MTKRYTVDWDEMYPVYNIPPPDSYEATLGRVRIDLTDEEKADYDRVMAEFETWQDRLAEARDAAGSYGSPISS